MQQAPQIRDDSMTQEFFAFLDQREKVSNWFLAVYIIAILLLTVIGGIALLS
ncbi:MAG: hypothetical protein AAB957_00945 [Patescibacteria group bacterium]